MPPREMRLDHGAIGNGSLIALVNPDSGIDWLCLPRFDSPSIFARILDEENGGTWRFLSGDRPVRGQMKYVRNTNVLLTRFQDGEDVWDVFDFAPRIPAGLVARTPLRIYRFLIPVQGQPRLTMEFDPRPGYGTVRPQLVPNVLGLELAGCSDPVSLFSNVPAPFIINRRPFVLDRPRYFGLCYGTVSERPHLDEIRRDLDLTIAGWRQWSQAMALHGFANREVIRSALCLKLHVYEETGAIIAASTTSIPEALDEPRTWDYRFCWLRDSVFTIEALRRVAHFQEGRNFILFLRDVALAGPLQPLYGIGGERDLHEEELPHLAGFHGTKPVRIGNAANRQQQHDLMGELVLCLRTLLMDDRVELHHPKQWFPLVERLVQEARELAEKPDLGIWEFRGNGRHHTFSKAMCWAALQHGATLADFFGEKEKARLWEGEARKLREQILDRAFNTRLGMFTQVLDGEHADASNLLLPALGLIQPKDERFLSTLDAYRKILVRQNGGVMRYVHNDDFGAPTNTFTICSFWWIEALALAGHLDEAIETFQAVMAHANPLGLLSEDIDDRSGMLLGNFPQAYTHVGLINAASTIGTMLQAREGRFHSWA